MLEFSGAIAYERAADAEDLAGWVASVGAFVLELTLAAGTLSAGLEQQAKNGMGRRGGCWPRSRRGSSLAASRAANLDVKTLQVVRRYTFATLPDRSR